MYKKYDELLDAIIRNSKSLKSAAVFLLEKAIKAEDNEQKLTMTAYAVNFLFAFVDELGKYFLVKSQYPENLNNINLRKIGFYSHNIKLKKIVSIVRNEQFARGSISPFTIEQTVLGLRKFKDETLYVDYQNGNVISPFNSVILKKESFKSYVDMVYCLEEMVKYDFELFKQNPFNK